LKTESSLTYRETASRKINGKENQRSHPNYGNSYSVTTADKKKKGLFGLFKGKKGKKKSDENYYQSPPRNRNFALHMMEESEQEI
jgi:hypothetical protein